MTDRHTVILYRVGQTKWLIEKDAMVKKHDINIVIIVVTFIVRGIHAKVDTTIRKGYQVGPWLMFG